MQMSELMFITSLSAWEMFTAWPVLLRYALTVKLVISQAQK